MIEAMTLDVDQSCTIVKSACMKKTPSRTIARAYQEISSTCLLVYVDELTRFATAGGSPRGLQETKTRMEPARRIPPKPLKK